VASAFYTKVNSADGSFNPVVGRMPGRRNIHRDNISQHRAPTRHAGVSPPRAAPKPKGKDDEREFP
jgi:hypothetical protein